MGRSNNNSIEFHFFCVKDKQSIVLKINIKCLKIYSKKNPLKTIQ
jgi:ribosomal protein L28